MRDRKGEEQEQKGMADICPKCNADRNQVRQMLKDDIKSDNLWLAIAMLRNCPACLKVIRERRGYLEIDCCDLR